MSPDRGGIRTQRAQTKPSTVYKYTAPTPPGLPSSQRQHTAGKKNYFLCQQYCGQLVTSSLTHTQKGRNKRERESIAFSDRSVSTNQVSCKQALSLSHPSLLQWSVNDPLLPHKEPALFAWELSTPTHSNVFCLRVFVLRPRDVGNH